MNPDLKELRNANEDAAPWSRCLHRIVFGSRRCIRCRQCVYGKEALKAAFRLPEPGEPKWEDKS